MKHFHPSQVVAARAIAGFFGANFAGLGDPPSGEDASSQIVPAEQPSTSTEPQPGSSSSPVDAETLRKIRKREREKALDSLAKGLVWSSILAGAVRGGVIGALSAPGWEPIARGVVSDVSLAAIGSGLGLYILGRKSLGGWLLLAGVLGGAAVVAWRLRRGARNA